MLVMGRMLSVVSMFSGGGKILFAVVLRVSCRVVDGVWLAGCSLLPPSFLLLPVSIVCCLLLFHADTRECATSTTTKSKERNPRKRTTDLLFLCFFFLDVCGDETDHLDVVRPTNT